MKIITNYQIFNNQQNFCGKVPKKGLLSLNIPCPYSTPEIVKPKTKKEIDKECIENVIILLREYRANLEQMKLVVAQNIDKINQYLNELKSKERLYRTNGNDKEANILAKTITYYEKYIRHLLG